MKSEPFYLPRKDMYIRRAALTASIWVGTSTMTNIYEV